jgi:pseudouridine-5'-phosphate glycosidase
VSLRASGEVQAALAAGSPVVALESTIVAHGLPWPQNLEIARALEAAVRAGGAVPATCAVLGGVLRAGLSEAELEQVARAGPGLAKGGATDLAVHVASGGSCATTVSATTIIAARAGIPIFATGGIGGVHRGDAGDVSSDLTVLARERMCVVSAGAKAILDLPRTLELLETLGVLVLGYQTRSFPAFYTRSSGLPLEHSVATPAQAARILRARWADEGTGGGVLLANPIPQTAELDAGMIDVAIDAALAAARARDLRGKALTPFLLAELARTTAGRAVAANRALALENARVAAAIACALALDP